MREGHVIYLIMDKEGRYITDEAGYARIWFSKKQAEMDKKKLEKKLKLKLKVVGREFFVFEVIPKNRRIEIGWNVI
mgnify:CR=1 FL=1